MTAAEPRTLRSVLPGVGLLFSLAVLAKVAGSVVPLDPLLLAVGLGVLVGNLLDLPATFDAGLALDSLFLETGIVLLGGSVSLAEVAAAGPVVLALVVLTVALGMLLAESVARRQFGLGDDRACLLAAGASVCGVSAATTVAGTLDTDREALASVVATVLLFDALTLVAFPLAGELLPLSAREFGVWVGLSMFSTGPVTAAGFAFSAAAGQWATITKLTRNALLGVVALVHAVRFAGGGDRSRVRQLRAGVPAFLVGFVLVATVANLGLLGDATLASLDRSSGWLFALAFAGFGLDVKLSTLRETGVAPVFVLLVQLLVVGTATLGAVELLL
jgi:uncharacterized integral membrane protein (TIGR00698 family)